MEKADQFVKKVKEECEKRDAHMKLHRDPEALVSAIGLLDPFLSDGTKAIAEFDSVAQSLGYCLIANEVGEWMGRVNRAFDDRCFGSVEEAIKRDVKLSTALSFASNLSRLKDVVIGAWIAAGRDPKEMNCKPDGAMAVSS